MTHDKSSQVIVGADWEYTIPCEGSIATSAAYFSFNDSDSSKKDFQEIKT